MDNYVVERLEGSEWIPKCQTNFEDTAQFIKIMQAPYYRILHNGVDVSARYGAASIPQSAANTAASSSPASTSTNMPEIKQLKPSAYKALPFEQRAALYESAQMLKANNLKRTEIFAQLNMSEATYDEMRKEFANAPAEQPQHTVSPAPEVEKTAPSVPQRPAVANRPRGLLYRR